MSYQPLGAPPSPVVSAQSGPRRTGLMVLGIALVVAGLAVGGVLLATSGSTEEDAVRDLARAPVNCTTTVHVDSPSTFVVFVETQGELTELDGGCVDESLEYDHSSSRIPSVEVTITDADGTELDLDRRSDVSYDVGGYRGESIREVTIDESGDYQLTVLSSADDVAIAVGKDPNGAGDAARTAGFVVIAAGVVLGLLLLIAGMRRKPAGPSGGSGVPPQLPTTAYATPTTMAPPPGGPPPPPNPFAPPTQPGVPPPRPYAPPNPPFEPPASWSGTA